MSQIAKALLFLAILLVPVYSVRAGLFENLMRTFTDPGWQGDEWAREDIALYRREFTGVLQRAEIQTRLMRIQESVQEGEFAFAALDVLENAGEDWKKFVPYVRRFTTIHQVSALAYWVDSRSDALEKMPKIIKFDNEFSVQALQMMAKYGRSIGEKVDLLIQINESGRVNRLWEVLYLGRPFRDYEISHILGSRKSCKQELE